MLLDAYGQPIKTGQLDAPQTASLPGLYRQYASHPSRGLTPAKLANILQSAETGNLLAQHDLFTDMEEKDPHLFAEMQKRKRAILGLEWRIDPPPNASAREKKAARALQENIRAIANFEDILLDMADGIGHGFSNLELEWQRQGAEYTIQRATHRPQSWFCLDLETRNTLLLRDNGHGQPLRPLGWIRHIHRAKSGYISRSGLFRVLAWPYLFKNYAVRDLAEFLEIYGLPLRVGHYMSGCDQDVKADLLDAVISLGHDAAAIIPEGMRIDFQQAASGSEKPFMAMHDVMERGQSKAILGGTLTSQADGKTSTNALGEVHNEVRHDLLVGDALQYAGTLTQDLVYPLHVVNGGDPARAPRFAFDLQEAADFRLLSEALPKLAPLFPIPARWAYQKTRIPEPEEGELCLQAPAPVVPPGAAAARLAALRAGMAGDPTPISDQTHRLADDAAPALAEWLDTLQVVVDNAVSLAALRDDLLAAFGDLDSQRLASIMALGLAAADLSGRFDAGEGV